MEKAEQEEATSPPAGPGPRAAPSPQRGRKWVWDYDLQQQEEADYFDDESYDFNNPSPLSPITSPQTSRRSSSSTTESNLLSSSDFYPIMASTPSSSRRMTTPRPSIDAGGGVQHRQLDPALYNTLTGLRLMKGELDVWHTIILLNKHREPIIQGTARVRACVQAIQAAVSDAFKTPEVIRMFANKQPDQLRLRLASLQRDVKIRQISKDAFQRQSVEILIALKKLGTTLTAEEQTFLDSLSSAAQLESAVDNVGDVTQSSLLSAASVAVRQAEK